MNKSNIVQLIEKYKKKRKKKSHWQKKRRTIGKQS